MISCYVMYIIGRISQTFKTHHRRGFAPARPARGANGSAAGRASNALAGSSAGSCGTRRPSKAAFRMDCLSRAASAASASSRATTSVAAPSFSHPGAEIAKWYPFPPARQRPRPVRRVVVLRYRRHRRIHHAVQFTTISRTVRAPARCRAWQVGRSTTLRATDEQRDKTTRRCLGASQDSQSKLGGRDEQRLAEGLGVNAADIPVAMSASGADQPRWWTF